MIVAMNPLRMGYIVGLLQFSSGNPLGIQPGDFLQISTSSGATPANTAVQIPIDGSIPQNTEGAAYAPLDTTIYPQRADSRLLVRVFIPIIANSNPNTNWVGALFRDSAVDAVCGNAVTIGIANQQYAFELFTSVPAVSQAPTTFSFRYGPASATTSYVLSSGTSPSYFGGSPTAFMTVMEIAA